MPSDIELLQRIAQQFPVQIVLASLSSPSVSANQETLLRVLSSTALLQRFPVPHQYIRRLLQACVTAVEKEGDAEVEDGLAEMLSEYLLLGTSTVCSPLHLDPDLASLSPSQLASIPSFAPHLPPGWSFKSYWLTADAPTSPITLHVSDNLFEGSTGCHEWEAGFALTELILNRSENFKGKTVLELGCGCGITGTALHHVGATKAYLTDGDASTVANATLNLRLNGLDCNTAVSCSTPDVTLQCLQHLWEHDPPSWMQPDVVIAADVLYDPELIPILIGLISRLVLKSGCGQREAIIVTTLRQEATLIKFIKAAEEAGFSIREERGVASHWPIRFEPHTALTAEARERIYVHTLRAQG